ncbi:exosortase A [Beggiatoa alba]|nr:exosortase A [Beggiatoa alba]
MDILDSEIKFDNKKDFVNWRFLLSVVSLTILFAVVVYWGTVESIGKIWWRSDTYAHGILIFPISIYLIYSRREVFASLTPNINIFGLVILAFLTFIWVFAYAANVLFVQQLVLVAMVSAIVLTLLGTVIFRAMLFPLSYLFFMVPIGESLTPVMQDFTAIFTVKLLQLTGIPVYLEGLYFSIPTGNFEVAEACSGVRYLIASVALGCLYAYVSYRSFMKRSIFILLCVVVPLIANVVRAYGIVMLAYLSDMRLAVGVDHIIYGWIFFGLVMFLIFWIGSYWRDPESILNSGSRYKKISDFQLYNVSKLAIVMIVTVFLIISGPATAVWIEKNSSVNRVVSLVAPNVEGSSYVLVANDNDSWHPAFQGATNEGRWVYSKNNGNKIHMYVAYYAKESENSELISTQNAVHDGKQWVKISSRKRNILSLSKREFGAIETQLRNGSENRLVWYWYFVSELQTEDEMIAKFMQAWSNIYGNKIGSAVVAIAADYLMNEQEARQEMLEFMKQSDAVWDTEQFWNNIIVCNRNCE